VSTLMEEHPGFSKVNAEAALPTPFGTTAIVSGPGVAGPDVKIFSISPNEPSVEP
jgi:hypothetical protein